MPDVSERGVERHGFIVSDHGNGAVALEWLAAADCPPDLLLTDVVMPRLGGWELAEAVHRMIPGLPAVFTSGHGSDRLTEAIGCHPAFRRLPKPYDGETLVRTLRVALGH